jgi:hypothetical protein
MAYDGEELFDHQVTAWTVGQLRQAMYGLPDDLPVSVLDSQEPGGEFADEQVVIGAAPWAEDLTFDKTDDKDAVLIARLVAQLRCYLPEPAAPALPDQRPVLAHDDRTMSLLYGRSLT